MEDYIQKIEKAERSFFPAKIESRQDGEDDIIQGVAAVVNKSTDLGWYDEEIAPGAFDDVLKDDVRALFNHDSNFPLARSVDGKGTLKLSVNKSGDLEYSFKVPDRTFARDLQDAIVSGDVTQSSFAFTVKEEKWEFATKENKIVRDKRIITKLEKLYDVSPVTYPAYKDTTVAARRLESIPQKRPVSIRKLKRRKFLTKYKK